MNRAKFAFFGALAVFAGLCYWLYREMRLASSPANRPVIVYCAEALRVPAGAIAADYEKETGAKVELRFGPSQAILTQFRLTGGDLFLPADDSYIELARQHNLVAEVLPLVRMQVVLLVRPGLETEIKTWQDLMKPGRKLALANPDAAAISKLTRAQLQKTGHWEQLLQQDPVFTGHINEVGSAVQLGVVDAGIVFDSVARQFPKAHVVRLPEFANLGARVQIGVAAATDQPPAALRFARYLSARDRGLLHLAKTGFTVPEDADAWQPTPELVVYAGAMLRSAIEPTLEEFEQREGVRLSRVYNGCGILVGSMKTGHHPDLYFSCDIQFMKQVDKLFAEPTVVSNNQLVIAVPKGNPHGIQSLKDLAKPGLKVGVGHEQQCALGQITKETFLTAGLYEQLNKNVAVHAPTGDLLVVQLRGGSLDAAVVYRSNVTPYGADLEGVPVNDIPCSIAQQPVAAGRQTPYPQLTRRLLASLQTPRSRERFESLGFGWER